MQPLLLGRQGPWPLAGHFRGVLSRECCGMAWAGRVAATGDLTDSWLAAGVVHRQLVGSELSSDDRRRALAEMWERIRSLDADLLGPSRGDDLHLLFVAWDAEAVSVSGVRLAVVLAMDDEGPARHWIPEGHPLCGPPGIPRRRPGALTVDEAPAWVVGVASSDAVPGLEASSIRTRAVGFR